MKNMPLRCQILIFLKPVGSAGWMIRAFRADCITLSFVSSSLTYLPLLLAALCLAFVYIVFVVGVLTKGVFAKSS